jgi:hypothetical protein
MKPRYDPDAEARLSFRVPAHVRLELIAIAEDRGITLAELLRSYVMTPPKARTPEG